MQTAECLVLFPCSPFCADVFPVTHVSVINSFSHTFCTVLFFRPNEMIAFLQYEAELHRSHPRATLAAFLHYTCSFCNHESAQRLVSIIWYGEPRSTCQPLKVIDSQNFSARGKRCEDQILKAKAREISNPKSRLAKRSITWGGVRGQVVAKFSRALLLEFSAEKGRMVGNVAILDKEGGGGVVEESQVLRLFVVFAGC